MPLLAAHNTGPTESEERERRYRSAFQLVDRNGDGLLSSEELCVFMRGVSKMEVEDVLREVDHDRDDMVSGPQTRDEI